MTLEVQTLLLGGVILSDLNSKNMERELTYAELHLLQESFFMQVKKLSVIFLDDEQEELCFADFVEQYVQGNDNPQIRFE